MSNFVLVHGAWHTGELFEPVAAVMRAQGHQVHLPTLAGNRPGDSKAAGLATAVETLVAELEATGAQDIILAGHSYAGMVITGAADVLGARIRRLVYWNAFVPNDGESLVDMVPPHYADLFESLVAEDGSVTLPFPIWREAFINDADLELAESAYRQLNPHPFKTFTDRIRLTRDPAAFDIPKSYLNCTEDTALPHSHGWHPRLSEKLGLFRLVQTPGSHELCFSAPAQLAHKLIEAGRD